MKPKKRAAKPRLKRGRDWHAWAWFDSKWPSTTMLSRWSESVRKPVWRPAASNGRWVRVRFEEVGTDASTKD